MVEIVERLHLWDHKSGSWCRITTWSPQRLKGGGSHEYEIMGRANIRPCATTQGTLRFIAHPRWGQNVEWSYIQRG